MAVSYRGFQIELYEEYLSDGGFVSDQRRSLLANPVGQWSILRDWEDRIEAYVDGLVVGGDLALDVCRRRAAEGEPSELEIAVRAFCRGARFDLIEAAADQIEDAERAQAICEGLLHERHAGVEALVRRLLGNPVMLPAMAKVAGYQRLPLAQVLMERGAGCPEVAWALGRLREPKSLPFLQDASNDPATRGPASLAFARITQTARHGESTLVGLVGDWHRLDQFHEDTSAASSLALGLLGSPISVPRLINRLPQPEAALALQLITGAGLITQKPLENEELEEGERPTLVAELQTEPEAWTNWWMSNSKNFLAIPSLRRGRPYSANELLRQLQEPECLHLERYWAIEQLACRHAMALGLEHDMFYTEQAVNSQ